MILTGGTADNPRFDMLAPLDDPCDPSRTMHRTRGSGLRRPAGPLLLLALIAAACSPSTSPAPSSPSPSPTPARTPPLPTPVPTPVDTPLPTATSVAPASGVLLVRLTGCSHTCGPEPGTTILDDGRVIWQDAELRPIEAQLTPEVLQRVRDEIAAADVLDTDADVQAELRPGAEPIGHGVSLYRFERMDGERRIVVTSGDPRDYADQAELWIIPPAMPILAGLADDLLDPVAWLSADAFTGPARAYEPDHYLVLIELYPQVGGASDFEADVDDVLWPFGAPIEGAGEPVDVGGAGIGSRCLVIGADEAAETAAAEKGMGSRRDLGTWLSSVEYGWERANGFVVLSMTPVLPHQTGTCSELVAADPGR